MAYILFIFMLLFSSPIMADQEHQDAITPVQEWVKAEKELLATMDRGNQEVFFVLRNKHSVIRSVEIVHRDIAVAVKACGKENAELKSAMSDRLKQWEGVVKPILKTAKKVLETELKEQEAFHITDYQHVIKLNDHAFNYSDKAIDKQLVTTPEACEGLLKSMDRTEDKLVNLLQAILLPENVIRQRVKAE